VNAVTGQELSVVSEIKGTTTDPVKKAMELLPLGPVLIIDTPGLDDTGELGEKRVKRALNVLENCDVAVLVHDSNENFSQAENDLIKIFEDKKIPFITANNKIDLIAAEKKIESDSSINVSALTGENINLLKEKLAELAIKNKNEKKLISDLLTPGDIIILVVPVDKAAPKGRLILPQQQTIREILDSHCSAFICQDNELERTLENLRIRPRLIVTDSQVFEKVNKIIPKDILLTSFSILFARYKGSLEILRKGAEKLKALNNNDKVLISEGCTHHRQCGDIGTEKIPAWIKNFTGSSPEFDFTSGGDFPDENELKKFSLIIHCGGCMLNEQEMKSRIKRAVSAKIPIVNYGIAIAEMHGILNRSLECFEKLGIRN